MSIEQTLALSFGVIFWIGFVYFVIAPLVCTAISYLGAIVGAVVHGETRKRRRHLPALYRVEAPVSDIRRELPREYRSAA